MTDIVQRLFSFSFKFHLGRESLLSRKLTIHWTGYFRKILYFTVVNDCFKYKTQLEVLDVGCILKVSYCAFPLRLKKHLINREILWGKFGEQLLSCRLCIHSFSIFPILMCYKYLDILGFSLHVFFLLS